MKKPIYIANEQLISAADAIADLEPCPFAGKITRDQILMTMGEHGDMWPVSILPDVIAEQT